ncbi:single-stranded DNA-binding protein [Faecalimonas umbilicata]|nr:single-stranded DNA-binding protein [Faecalimonas umbilicata]
MSVITHLMGRVTRDPVVQQAKNTGTEYINLDLAVTQRSQNNQNGQNPYETVYYQCYFNKFLADRLQKAGVKKGTVLYLYGDLELHPFIYQQGQRAGQPGINAKINVKDWDFPPSNKPANESGSTPGMNPNGNAAPANGGYPNQGAPNGGGYMGAASAQNPVNPVGNAAPNNGYAGNGNYTAPPAQQTPPASYGGGANYRAPAGNNSPSMYGGAPAAGAGNSFQNVPEYQAGQLPFA